MLRKYCTHVAFASLAFQPLNVHAESMANPIVPSGQLGEFRHGTYPSPGIGDGDWTHAGIDVSAPCGARVYSFADGRVVDVISNQTDSNFHTLGYMVLIEHPATLLGRTFYTIYLHLQEPPVVHKGNPVQGGTTFIGRVGDTGIAFGCHTHFEVRRFSGRFFSGWANIYGKGDQRQLPAFAENWGDPESLFRKYPSGLTAAPAATAVPSESQTGLGPEPDKAVGAEGSIEVAGIRIGMSVEEAKEKVKAQGCSQIDTGPTDAPNATRYKCYWPGFEPWIGVFFDVSAKGRVYLARYSDVSDQPLMYRVSLIKTDYAISIPGEACVINHIADKFDAQWCWVFETYVLYLNDLGPERIPNTWNFVKRLSVTIFSRSIYFEDEGLKDPLQR